MTRGSRNRMESMDYKVARLMDVRPETRDVSTFLITLEGEEEFIFQPGQFNMIGLPGLEEAPLSMSSLPVPRNNLFAHTVRCVGNLTSRMAGLRAGETLMMRGPFGRGWPVQELDHRDVLMVAGGLGLAPLRPLLLHCLEHRGEIGDLVLVYGAKTPEEMLFQKELFDWQEKCPVTTLYCADHLANGSPTALRLREGLVTTFLEDLDLNPPDTLVCVCGPEIMMRFVARQLLQEGYLKNRIYVSLERRMRCGTAHCGHCQIGAKFVCQDGPVFPYAEIARFSDTLL